MKLSHALALPDTTGFKPTRNEVLARLEIFERTAHKRCADCGRFVPKDHWVTKLTDQRKDPNARIVQPLCDSCYAECELPEW